MEQIFTPQTDYKVLVRCYTYNHSKYIKDALNGFAMQKTDFPFVCLVMDDCSTDGEQDVIKAWMESECDMEQAKNVEIEKSFVIIVPHKTNASCTFAFYLLKQNLHKTGGKKILLAPWRDHSDYEALCEGDDYWTDSLKLQKQVDFLESHPDFSMCFHNAVVENEANKATAFQEGGVEDMEYYTNDIFPRWIIPTASVVYRGKIVSAYPIKHREMLLYGDICLFLTCTHVGRVWGMREVMSLYRINTGGVTQQEKAPDYRLWIRHERCLRMNFPQINHRMINEHISGYYYSLARNGNSILRRISDFMLAILNSPVYVLRKWMDAIRRKV